MPSDDIAISVSNLTKVYRLFGHPGDRIKQFASLGLKQYHREFTALKDVSFDIRRGETIGIIGSNGSGKSTLLQLICGILKPTSGAVRVNGRVSALLELGAGFNPEFTGRENVFFQGALMGFTHAQMDERFDEIATFADIGEFIDQPVRTYSSGMFVRLAFAVAVHIDPDILIVDEALSVGDATFQGKSMQHMQRMVESGCSLLIVSHDLNAIKSLCRQALWLQRGGIHAHGQSGEICDAYQRTALTQRSVTAIPAVTAQKEQRGVCVEFVEVDPSPAPICQFGSEICLRIGYLARDTVPSLVASFYIKDAQQLDVLGSNTAYEGITIGPLAPGERGRVEFRFRNPLRAGTYGVTVILADRATDTLDFYEWRDHACYFESQDLPGQTRWALTCPEMHVRQSTTGNMGKGR